MRAALVPVLLLATAWTGCLSDDETPPADDEGQVDGPGATFPSVAFDAADTVATLESFAQDFPNRFLDGPDHNAARDWLAGEFEALGYEVVRQEFLDPQTAPVVGAEITGVRLVNVIGIKWGTDRDQWVVVGGHYDTVYTAGQGAYDDGSGTLLTLGMARALKDVPLERTVAFVAFDGEERGLRGSRYLVDSILPDAYDIEAEPFTYRPTLFGHVDLDMFGINHPAPPPIVFDQNSPEIKAFVENRSAALGIPEDKVLYRGITAGRSDYASFEDAGVPVGFFISDFDDVWYQEFQVPRTYPFWHQADTVETMTTMAGGRESLVAGFQTALDLSGALVVFLSDEPGLLLTVEEPEEEA